MLTFQSCDKMEDRLLLVFTVAIVLAGIGLRSNKEDMDQRFRCSYNIWCRKHPFRLQSRYCGEFHRFWFLEHANTTSTRCKIKFFNGYHVAVGGIVLGLNEQGITPNIAIRSSLWKMLHSIFSPRSVASVESPIPANPIIILTCIH